MKMGAGSKVKWGEVRGIARKVEGGVGSWGWDERATKDRRVWGGVGRQTWA